MRDELLAVEQFDSLLEARVLVADWRIEYYTYRPHSALGMLTPVEFAEQWRQPQLIAGGPRIRVRSDHWRKQCSYDSERRRPDFEVLPEAVELDL